MHKHPTMPSEHRKRVRAVMGLLWARDQQGEGFLVGSGVGRSTGVMLQASHWAARGCCSPGCTWSGCPRTALPQHCTLTPHTPITTRADPIPSPGRQYPANLHSVCRLLHLLPESIGFGSRWLQVARQPRGLCRLLPPEDTGPCQWDTGDAQSSWAALGPPARSRWSPGLSTMVRVSTVLHA